MPGVIQRSKDARSAVTEALIHIAFDKPFMEQTESGGLIENGNNACTTVKEHTPSKV